TKTASADRTARTRARAPIASGLAGGPPPRPLGLQVLAHVKVARELVALHLAREREVEGVAVVFLVRAAELHGVPVDRPAHLARDEVALVRAVEIVAALAEVEGVDGGPRRVLDADRPLAGQVRGRGRRPRGRCGGRARERAEEPIGDRLLLARGQHVRGDRDAGPSVLGGAPSRGEERDPRLGLEEVLGDRLAVDAVTRAVPQDEERR